MQVSAEVRWFWDRGRAAEVKSWFLHGGVRPGGGERTRIDRYVRAGNSGELGVKVRDEIQGRPPDVEIKGLCQILDAKQLGIDAPNVGVWCKWKAAGVAFDGGAVTKKLRWLRKFDCGGNSPAEIALGGDEQPLSGGKLPEIGCNIELTQLYVEGREPEWWTLCVASRIRR